MLFLILLVALLSSAPSQDQARVTLHGSGSFQAGGAYPTTQGTTNGPAFASWSGADACIGKLESETFPAPVAIEIKVAGYPSNPGNDIYLERRDVPERFRLQLGIDPRENWQTKVVLLPIAWFHHPTRFIATDGSRGFQGWIGVADVRPLTLIETIAGYNRLTAGAALPAVFVIWLAPGFAVFLAIARSRVINTKLGFVASILTSSAIGLLTFFISLATPVAGTIFSAIVVTATGGALIFPLRKLLFRYLRDPDVIWPFALSLAAALVATTILALNTPNGDLVYAAQNAFGWSMPPDNILPGLLSDHVRAHAPARPFLGDWLSSDRPPLQSGIDLFLRSVALPGDFTTIRYQSISTVAQCISLGVVFCLARAANASIRGSLLVVASIATSGFFLTNATFVWPKLLAAALGGSSIIFYSYVASLPRRYALCGLCLGLAMMAHGGVVFTFPALAAAAYLKDRQQAAKPFAIGLAVFVVVMIPWSLYQHYIDPPGDRLLKWHLAGDTLPDRRTFGSVLTQAYVHTAPAEIVANKVENIGALFARPGLSPRQNQFFGTFPALGAIPLGAAGLLLRGIRRRRRSHITRWALTYLGIGLISLMVWCILMFGPASTIVHQGSYLTMLLLMTGLMLSAIQFPPLAIFIVLYQCYFFETQYFVHGLEIIPPTVDTISTTFMLLLSAVLIAITFRVGKAANDDACTSIATNAS